MCSFTLEAKVTIDGVQVRLEPVGTQAELSGAALQYAVARRNIMTRVASLSDGTDVLQGASPNGSATVILHTEAGIVGPFAGIVYTPHGVTVVAEVIHLGSNKKKAS